MATTTTTSEGHRFESVAAVRQGLKEVEYLADEGRKDEVRRASRELILHPVEQLEAIADLWEHV